MKRTRSIIRIDESKCDGCGLCIPACSEGALRIVDGKARLVSEIRCDGLGTCLGKCPTGALTVEEREASEFDAKAAASPVPDAALLPCGCPGTMSRSLSPRPAARATVRTRQASELRQWPVKLRLVPSGAPCLKGAALVLLADCAAAASANLHDDFLRGRAVAMACPKFDDTEGYAARIAAMVRDSGVRSIEVVMMEVPCCHGLLDICLDAVSSCGASVPVTRTILGLEGEVIESVAAN